jgi:hypothetical protein
LGVFACIPFRKDDTVTEYGGFLREEAAVRATGLSHARRDGDGRVRDGRLLSLLFDRSTSSCSISPSCPIQYLHAINYEGCGYMVNTASREQCNVKVVLVSHRRCWDGTPRAMFLVATKAINLNDEVLCPYRNSFSRELVLPC